MNLFILIPISFSHQANLFGFYFFSLYVYFVVVKWLFRNWLLNRKHLLSGTMIIYLFHKHCNLRKVLPLLSVHWLAQLHFEFYTFYISSSSEISSSNISSSSSNLSEKLPSSSESSFKSLTCCPSIAIKTSSEFGVIRSGFFFLR